jgi:hypothetical protein
VGVTLKSTDQTTTPSSSNYALRLVDNVRRVKGVGDAMSSASKTQHADHSESVDDGAVELTPMTCRDHPRTAIIRPV